MTSQELAATILPAREYLREAGRLVLSGTLRPIYYDMSGKEVHDHFLTLSVIKKEKEENGRTLDQFQKLRLNTSSSVASIERKLVVQKDRLNNDEIDCLKGQQTKGLETIGKIISIELATDIIDHLETGKQRRPIYLPTLDPINLITKKFLVEHIDAISGLTGDYHKKLDLEPGSTVIGSIGALALFHYENIDYPHPFIDGMTVGSAGFLHITPTDLLSLSSIAKLN